MVKTNVIIGRRQTDISCPLLNSWFMLVIMFVDVYIEPWSGVCLGLQLVNQDSIEYTLSNKCISYERTTVQLLYNVIIS